MDEKPMVRTVCLIKGRFVGVEGEVVSMSMSGHAKVKIEIDGATFLIDRTYSRVTPLNDSARAMLASKGWGPAKRFAPRMTSEAK